MTAWVVSDAVADNLPGAFPLAVNFPVQCPHEVPVAAHSAPLTVSARIRLHEIKNAWSKATTGERHEFIAWARKAAAATVITHPLAAG